MRHFAEHSIYIFGILSVSVLPSIVFFFFFFFFFSLSPSLVALGQPSPTYLFLFIFFFTQVSLAERVAWERCDNCGKSVGFSIRLENKSSNETQLLFCTTGILLRKLVADPTLQGLTHIVIDEVHERDRDSDFLLIILREMLPQRPNLRVVLMSATIQCEKFSDYFGGAPIVELEGRCVQCPLLSLLLLLLLLLLSRSLRPLHL